MPPRRRRYSAAGLHQPPLAFAGRWGLGLLPNSPSRLPKCRVPPSAGPPRWPLAANCRRPPASAPAGCSKGFTQPFLSAAGPSRAAGDSVNCCRSLKGRRSKEQATSKAML